MIGTHRLMKWVALATVLFLFTGCSFVFHKRSPKDTRKIDELKSEVSRLNRELSALDAIKANLERRLRDEVARGEVDLKVEDRGVVITSLAEVYFNSGKAKLRKEANPVLKKIAFALRELRKGRNISVEGHTDNVPIKHSSWKSNQELSEARAKSVANFLKKENVSASIVSTEGYADRRPVTSNATAAGRQKNRRVEIVILSRDNLQKGSFGGRRGAIK